MGWFRSHRRIGSGLALIALVIHFALSFGHLHVPTFENATAVVLSSSEPAASIPDAPGSPLTHPGLADPCAICANIHLVVALLVAWPAWLLPLGGEQALPGSSGVTE